MSDTAEHHEHHVHPQSHYVKIWAALLALLIVSVVGPEVGAATGFQSITLFTAFGIAVVKAAMVMKFFMHLDLEKKMIWYILAGSLVLMAQFFFGVAADVMNHSGTNWDNVAAEAEIARALEAQKAGGGHGDHGGGHGGDAHGEKPHDDGHEGGH